MPLHLTRNVRTNQYINPQSTPEIPDIDTQGNNRQTLTKPIFHRHVKFKSTLNSSFNTRQSRSITATAFKRRRSTDFEIKGNENIKRDWHLGS